MKISSLIFAIFYSIVSLWWTFRFVSSLPQTAEQAKWITTGDVLSLVAFGVLAAYHWFVFARSKKQKTGHRERE